MPPDTACNKNAESFLDDSLELAKQLPGEDPGGSDHVHYYNTLRTGYARLIGDLVVTYGRAECWSAALRALGSNRRANLKLEAQVHLLQELVRQGELQAAAAFQDTLIFPDSSDGREARAMVAFSLGRGFVLSGAVEDGKQHFMSIDTRWHHLESPVYLFVKALLEADRLEAATRYLSNHSPRDVHRQNARILVIRHLIAKGYKEKARERIRSIISSERASRNCPRSFETLYAQLGDLTKAIRCADSIEPGFERARTLAWIAQIAPRDAGVQQALDAAVDAMATCVGNDCDTIWALVAKEHANAGYEPRAVQLISEHIREEHRRVHALSVVAVSLARRGDIAGALQFNSSISVYGDKFGQALAIAYGRVGDFESAFAIFESTKNHYIKFTIAAALASQSLPTQLIPAWLRHSDSLPEGSRAAVYQVMMSLLARRSESNAALGHINEDESSLTGARALLGLAQGELGIVTGEDWLTTRGIL